MAKRPRPIKAGSRPSGATLSIESWETMQQQIATLKSLTKELEQEIARTRELQSRMWPKRRREDPFASQVDPPPSKRKRKKQQSAIGNI